MRLTAFIAALGIGLALPAAAQEPAKVTVAVLPALDAMPIYVAQAKRYFAKAGIDASIQRFQGGPAVLQSVLAGAAQFALAGVVPFINATARDAKIRAIGVDAFFNRHSRTMGIFARKDSAIRKIKDLAGHTVGINQRGNVESMIIATQMLPKEGMSASSIKLVELPYPLMRQSVAGGRVDAAIAFQPFSEFMSRDPKLRLIGYLDQFIPDPGYAITFAVVQSDYGKEHPEVVHGYVRALSEALAFARESPQEAAQIVATAFKLPVDVIAPALKSIDFARDESDVDPVTWEKVVAGMKKVGAIPSSYEVRRYIAIGR